MPDGVSPAAEAISASEDALMPDSEAAAIMSSLSSGAGSNDCLLIMPVPAADSSAAPVVGTIAVAGCPNCHGNHRWAHTCGKKRNGSSVVAASRSLRQRGESSGPASSTTSAASAAGGASEQTPRALDFEPAATAKPPPRYKSAVPKRQNDAHLVPPAADAEPPHGAETAVMELVEMPSVSEATPPFEFAKLLKVTLASPGSNEKSYELEAVNGSTVTVQKSEALRYPLKAFEGEMT